MSFILKEMYGLGLPPHSLPYSGMQTWQWSHFDHTDEESRLGVGGTLDGEIGSWGDFVKQTSDYSGPAGLLCERELNFYLV